MLCQYVESCGESPESLPVGPRSHECDNKQTKKMISLLRFACNTDLGPKTLVACSINRDFKIRYGKGLLRLNKVKITSGDVSTRVAVRLSRTPRQNVYTCARLSISGRFFSHTFQSDQSLPCPLGFTLCAACGCSASCCSCFLLFRSY